MHRLLPLLLLLTLPAFAQDPPVRVPAPAGALAGPLTVPLPETLAALTGDPLYATADVSVQVVDAASGAPVWAWGDDRALTPASTMKLLTAATALRELGPGFRFPTWVQTTGDLDAQGVLSGSLYIKGQGDPTMVVERMWRMILDIRLRGINEVRGDVVFDDGYFQDSPLIPGWTEESDVVDGPAYYAPLGALSVNYNIAAIIVRPGPTVGSSAVAAFETPTPAVALENHLTTGSARSRKWIKLERVLVDARGVELKPPFTAATTGVATFRLTGNVPLDSDPDELFRSLSDPLTNYIGTFEALAKQHGLKVRGDFKAGPTPTSAKLLLKSESDPLVEILAQMNKMSNNFMAEQVLRSVGAEKYGLPGTTEKGVRAIGDYLGSLGIPADSYQVANGSGLTRLTRIRPSAMNAVLVNMYRNPAYATEFVNTLSVGGRDGTLRYRFREDGMEGRVRGKSGTLDGVRCLAGYVDAVDGRTYAFTFLVNNINGASARAKGTHDRLVLALAGTSGNVVDGAEDPAEAN